MLLRLNWVYFFNWMRLIGWFVSLISPGKAIKEIEDEKKLWQDVNFKKHMRKWKLRFLIVPIVFAIIFLLLSISTKQLLASYFGGLFAVVVAYGIVSKYEMTERKTLKGQGDGSVC